MYLLKRLVDCLFQFHSQRLGGGGEFLKKRRKWLKNVSSYIVILFSLKVLAVVVAFIPTT
jgi:hypothetical protein